MVMGLKVFRMKLKRWGGGGAEQVRECLWGAGVNDLLLIFSETAFFPEKLEFNKN